MRKSSGGNVLLAALLLITLASTAAGVLYLWQTRQNPPTTPPSTVTAPPETAAPTGSETAARPPTVVSPTPAADETASWKTYTDTRYHFEFQYPANWFVKDLTNLNSNPSIQKEVYFNDNEKIDFSNFKVSMTLSTTSYDMHVRFLGYADAGFIPKVESSESGMLKGHRLTKAVRSISEFGQDMGKDYVAIISLGETTLNIYGKNDNKNTVDQILATFKFLD